MDTILPINIEDKQRGRRVAELFCRRCVVETVAQKLRQWLDVLHRVNSAVAKHAPGEARCRAELAACGGSHNRLEPLGPHFPAEPPGTLRRLTLRHLFE